MCTRTRCEWDACRISAPGHPISCKQGRTCLGLEYFVFEGDVLWSMADDDLVALGTEELATLGLVQREDVEKGFVVRMPKAYPVYDAGYHLKVQAIRAWLEAEAPNVHPVGPQRHASLQQSGPLDADRDADGSEALYGEPFDTWAVNVDSDYHEEQVGRRSSASPSGGTGRAVPTPVGS